MSDGGGCQGSEKQTTPACCCRGGGSSGVHAGTPAWQCGTVDTVAGAIPVVTTQLSAADRLGALRVRLNLGRMNYRIDPGLYAVGKPTPDSPVLVTANYKLTFDRLRQELGSLNAWLLVLDTDGINVWCAAGKGTFGTDELVKRIAATDLARVVTHRTLILPQLGAPGVAAHRVQARSEFKVVYGPVRARDLPAFLAAGMRATPEMRRVNFGVVDRLVVIPVEFTIWFKYTVLLAILLGLIGGFTPDGYSLHAVGQTTAHAGFLVLLAMLTGLVVVPLLLPWLPGRAFAAKGSLAGFSLAALLFYLQATGHRPGTAGACENLAWLLLLPTISSFMALNYTGTTTFTSVSGVKAEMKVAVPVQLLGLAGGLGLFLAARLL